MDYFQGDYYGQRCRSGKNSGDIFNDYLDMLDDIACDESKLNWQLSNDATAEEFVSWGPHMLQIFLDMLPMIPTWTILHVLLLQSDAWM
jgi:hypothetical protein